MTETSPPRKRRRTLAKALVFALASVLVLLLLLTTAAILILPSAWFREKVRTRMIYEIERATGGQTEVGAFHFDWSTLTAEVTNFVLHGTEPQEEDPLFRAASIRVGLRIVSVMKRDIDLAMLHIEQPRINILVAADGSTNFPRPKVQRPSGRDPIEQVLRLAIREITLRNGTLHYGDQKMPLDVRGRYLSVKLDYDFDGPRYAGTVAMRELTVDPGPVLPMTFAFNSSLSLLKNRIEIHRAHLGMTETTVDISGTIEDFRNVQMQFDVTGTGALSELGKPLRLPIEPTGQASFAGRVTYNPQDKLRLAGKVTGQHLAYREGRVNLRGISLVADVDMDMDLIRLRNVTAHALDGVFNGSVDIRETNAFRVAGDLTGVSVRSLTRMVGFENANFAGTIAGPMEVSGTFRGIGRSVRAGGRFTVTASQEGVPVRGFVEASYEGKRNLVQFGQSTLTLPSSTVSFSGALGERLAVQLQTADLSDLRPAIAMFSENPPEIPLKLLSGGSASFDGTVAGPLASPKITGAAILKNGEVRNQRIDRLTATVYLDQSEVQLSSVALGQDTLVVEGSFSAALNNWRIADVSAVKGSLAIRGARVPRLLAEAGQKLPVEGILAAQAEVSGTAGTPEINAKMTVAAPVVYGQRFDQFRATIRYGGEGVQVINGVAEAGKSRILLSGTYKHPPGDWRNGTMIFDVGTENWTLQQVHQLRNVKPGVTGSILIKGSGTILVRNGEVLPQVVNGDIDLQNLAVEGRAVGDFSVNARTQEKQLSAGVAGNLRGSNVTGNATVEIGGDYPITGTLAFSPMPLAVAQDLALAARGREPYPVDGFVSGRIQFSGPARTPQQINAKVELPVLEVIPSRRAMTQSQREQFAFRNQSPLLLEYDGKAVQVRDAHLVGQDTDLTIAGTIQLNPKAAWDLKVSGNLNAGVLQSFDEDIISSGAAVVNAAVRGPLEDPQLAGRMELKAASFYLADFPNGLDDINGVILFDQRRANIEKLTATTGGGNLAVGGFVGFAAGELMYRLQIRADSVRIRYPEGVSTTANAALNLTGTYSKSLLAGVVTVVRASFNPRTDVGGLLASSPAPVVPTTTQNEFLRGLQFDVRVETVPNLQLQTTLTNNVQAEADLRLRGTASKPVLLGRFVVSEGEIQFFGNRYTINRGEVGFFNPIRVEPVLDLDLETRVRGVLVNIKLNGSFQKLNVSYRSDPPLQSTEIIALLAVGRAPMSGSSLASSQTVMNQTFLASSTNSLLGQAIAAPISSRLQRFFGVSRLKIDPHLTGLSAVPQARLTIEQQISRDITLTYVTNLSQANQQIIRLEWDIDRTWSVVAVREENGVFGVDFFFKKRFR